MSLPDTPSNRLQDEDEDDDEFSGHVNVETRSLPWASSDRHSQSQSHTNGNANGNANVNASASVGAYSHKTPISWAYNDEYEVPVVGGEGEDQDSTDHLSSPPRSRARSHRQRAPNLSYRSDDSFFPPSIDGGANTNNMNMNMNGPNNKRSSKTAQNKKSGGAAGGGNSFRNWLAAGAVDILRLTGGVALTTTEYLVSPPLQMTRLLLPGLLASLLEYIDLVTPPRCKDWFRIASASIYHVVSVLRHTDKGKEFRTQVGNVGGDLRELLSSDVARQVLMDGMASSVKAAEAFHTPEMHAWLEQLSVLGCRLVDAAASGTNKQLIHDVYELVWSGVEVLADPQSTLALAEVTAYLCHALEMEDALPRPDDPPTNATRRYQRNAQQSQTYGIPQVLQDPDATVEQVILSSLGKVHADVHANANVGGGGGREGGGTGTAADPGNLETSSIPSNVVFDDVEDDADADADADATSADYWKYQAVQNQVNIPYLQQKMEQRSQQLQQDNRRTPTNPLSSSSPFITTTPTPGSAASSHMAATIHASSSKPTRTIPNLQNTKKENGNKKTDTNDVDIEDIVVDTVSAEEDDHADGGDHDRTAIPRPKPKPQEREDPVVSAPPPPNRLEGETAVMHFYRILDEVLQKKRETRVNELLGSVGIVDVDVDPTSTTATATPAPPSQSWYPRAAAAAGAGNERGQETMKRRLASLKSRAAARKASEIGVGSSTTGTAAAAGTTAKAASATAASKWPNLRDFVNQRQHALTPQNSQAISDLMVIYNQYRTLILVVVGVAVFLAWMVSSFALYGIYKFFFPAGFQWTLPFGLFSSSSSSSSLNIPRILQEASSTSSTAAAPSSSELVIRVIRQVVHVNQDGTILEKLTDPLASASAATSSSSTEEDVDRIAQCVASAFE